MRTLAELIDDLFRMHRRPDGREYTHIEVCVALGGAIEPSHLSKLRRGGIVNPGRDVLLALCRFFKVPPTYFFPELTEETTETTKLQTEDPLRIALRSTSLTPEVQAKIEALIRALEQQDPTS
jgi:transcriptional regulator with XRE-family HTH domain